MEYPKWNNRNNQLGGKKMNKKKIELIIGIVLFIAGLILIAIVYNSGTGNQEELEEEATNVGVIRINDDNFEREMLNTDKILVLDFYENMCPPCTSMIPTIIKLAKLGDEVKVGMINTSDRDTSTLSKTFEINATPTIVILKDGKVIEKFIGATKEETIMSVIDKLMVNKNEE